MWLPNEVRAGQAAEAGAVGRLDGGDERRAGLGDLGVGQGAVGGLEAER